MFEQTFKNIDDILHKDAGCGSELDYVEQTSWVLFLKYLDDLERDRATAAELTGKTYTPIIIEPEYQWCVWAAPKLERDKLSKGGSVKILYTILPSYFFSKKRAKGDWINKNTSCYL
ncbi:type I restriction-modification system subunit M N-terminal domain-containing protein [Cyclobacterium salsum]|uniref:type I restriction-modification system subunit M N-terminal domain-containing protein n=1 Tax=Cyclobacterium salsum TaxID=2666329 RepID=UPI00192F065D|nr:type I restriction-modification system subunit M N-terminal domain-containing protein [Cyclobacterium salsum]